MVANPRVGIKCNVAIWHQELSVVEHHSEMPKFHTNRHVALS